MIIIYALMFRLKLNKFFSLIYINNELGVKKI